jgi:hypothetical protein
MNTELGIVNEGRVPIHRDRAQTRFPGKKSRIEAGMDCYAQHGCAGVALPSRAIRNPQSAKTELRGMTAMFPIPLTIIPLPANPIHNPHSESNPVKPSQTSFQPPSSGQASPALAIYCGFPGTLHNQWWFAHYSGHHGATQSAIRAENESRFRIGTLSVFSGFSAVKSAICNPQSAIGSPPFSLWPLSFSLST